MVIVAVAVLLVVWCVCIKQSQQKPVTTHQNITIRNPSADSMTDHDSNIAAAKKLNRQDSDNSPNNLKMSVVYDRNTSFFTSEQEV